MIERIKKYLKPSRKTDENDTNSIISHEQFSQYFYSRSEHQWINTNKFIRRKFDELIEILDQKKLQFLMTNKVLFIRSSGRYSCALSQSNQNIIIVFPELYKLLKVTASQFSLAILAHELGHIFCGHSQASIDPLEAQVEADRFACELGFTQELIDFLEDAPETIEKRVRISYLTMNVFKNLKDV